MATKKLSKQPILECPNCSSIWGMEEIDWQNCDACGWPDNEDDDEDTGWDEGDEDDNPDDEDLDKEHDSRNL